MKLSKVIIVLAIATAVNIVLSQDPGGRDTVNSFYVKAGYELLSFSNSSVFSSGRSAGVNEGLSGFTGSLGYVFSKKLNFEVQYKSVEDVSYGYGKEAYMVYPGNEVYYLYGSGSISSHYINLKADYFVNEDKRSNPLYFIWSLNFGFQHVRNSESKEYPDRIETVSSNYTRFIAGPEAGIGIYFDLGVLSFHTEMTFSSRTAFLKSDKKYTENSLMLNFSPILNFN